MSDIIDYIRSKLSDQPITLETVNATLLDARMEFGGEMHYVKTPKMRDLPKLEARPRRSVGRRSRGCER